jgi:hypothetical protein
MPNSVSPPSHPLSSFLESQILLSRHHANGVGVAHAASPALDADDTVTTLHHAQLDGLCDAPLQTLVNIQLPVLLIEIWLAFREAEGIDATVEMGISRGTFVAGDHDDWADWSIFGEDASRGAAAGKQIS